MSKAGTEMFEISREARAQQRARLARECSIIVILLILLPLGIASARALTSAAQSVSATSVGADANREIRVRKSVTALTTAERKEFVDAVMTLKQAKSPYDTSLNYYDQFVQWHKDRYVCHTVQGVPITHSMLMVHTGPMFRLLVDLCAVDPAAPEKDRGGFERLACRPSAVDRHDVSGNV